MHLIWLKFGEKKMDKKFKIESLKKSYDYIFSKTLDFRKEIERFQGYIKEENELLENINKMIKDLEKENG